MDYATLGDPELLQLIAHQNTDALSALYDRYGRLVFSIAHNAVNTQQIAEEITQDVFLRIWENAQTYKVERGKVATWISSITRYRAIDMLRKHRVRPESKSIYWDDLSPGNLPRSFDLENHIELSQRREQVRVALATLPEEQKNALALAYFRGYTHREIAKVLDLPIGTVKTRIRLGMQKLRIQLEEIAVLEEDPNAT